MLCTMSVVKNDFMLVLSVCLWLPQVTSIQLKLVNHDKDNAYASTYNNYEPETYSYNYGIADQETDHQTKWEKRENGVVRGAYTIAEPDGSTTLVEYTADENGFHPVIRKLDVPANSLGHLKPVYNINTPNLDVYNPDELIHRNQYDQKTFTNNYNYDFNNPYSNNIYRTPGLNIGYNNGFSSDPRFTGYRDGTYRRYDDSGVSGAPHHLPLRQEKQPVPLLHSAYHGYDNLFH